MNLQHERIARLCDELRLERIATEYPALAQKAAEEEASFTEFLERLLAHEAGFRQERCRQTLTFREMRTQALQVGHFYFGVHPVKWVRFRSTLTIRNPSDPAGCSSYLLISTN